MKWARLYFLIVWIGFHFFINEMTLVQAQQVPLNDIEIIVAGKRYKSVLAYKREQIKKILVQSLSSMNLHNFSEEELSDIIKEVRNLQIADTLKNEAIEPKKQQSNQLQRNQMEIEEDAHDLNTSQMQEMLRDYSKEHKDAPLLLIDPDKVKSIFIEPSKP